MSSLASMPGIVWQERVSLSRPAYLGTRRRSRMGATRAGAGNHPGELRRMPAPGASSLDTVKYVQTSERNLTRSCADVLADLATPYDEYRAQLSLHRSLLDTYHILWQDHAAAGHFEESVKWEKRWLRLHNCRTEWVGFRADCCKSMTQPFAEPIGCMDRLCPMCAADRSRIARKRIRNLFDRLTHPILLTLTIPNQKTISKHDFTLFRQRVRSLLARYKTWARGGVYSIETTYNRREKTWHIHAHVLLDGASPLPGRESKVDLAGWKMFQFTAFKLRLEFEWLRLWKGDAWGKSARRNASNLNRAGDHFTFEEWVRQGRANAVKVWSNYTHRYELDPTLSPRAILKRMGWNKDNRIVVDIRPVHDREGAAREVLKYLTKVADFGDIPEAVEPFMNAVRGARLISTFGTWYGVKLDDPETQQERFAQHDCACGLRMFKRMGIFYRRDVEMDSEGRWWLTRAHDWKSAGTIPRPTIRALEDREE